MCCVFGCVCVCVCARVQSCLTLCGPMNCRLPGSSVHAIFQAWILELDPISYSKGSSQPSQGLNIQLLSLLHLQADSLLLCLLESPYIYAVCVCVCVCVCIYIYVVQLLGHIRLFGNPMDCSTPGLPVLHHLPKLVQSHVVESVLLSNYIVLCCPLLLLSSVFPGTRVFFNESTLCIRWPKY